jgi:hypothetical protein
MFNVTPKVHLKESHEAPMLDLIKPHAYTFGACHVCKYLVFQRNNSKIKKSN